MVPRGNRGSRVCWGRPPGRGFGDALEACAAVPVRFVCVPLSLCARCAVAFTPCQKPQVDSRGPQAPGFLCARPWPHSPTCSVRPVVAWGCSRPSPVSTSSCVATTSTWPGSAHLVVACPVAPAPLLFPSELLVSEPPAGGRAGCPSSRLRPRCFPSRAWELDLCRCLAALCPRGFQADLPENPNHRLCFQGGGWVIPRAFVLSRAEALPAPAASWLRNTRRPGGGRDFVQGSGRRGTRHPPGAAGAWAGPACMSSSVPSADSFLQPGDSRD